MFSADTLAPSTTPVSAAAATLQPLDRLRDELTFGIRRYGRSRSPAIALQVASALERLLRHPDFHADLAERCICKRMLAQWRILAG